MATPNTALFSLLLSIALITLLKTQTVDCAVVSITSNFPRDGPTVSLVCKQHGVIAFSGDLTPDEDHKFNAANNVYPCEALWVAYVASFEGYNPGRDGAQASIYWMVDQSGWYLSYDNIKFTKQADWKNASK